jgi:hypothetical protein
MYLNRPEGERVDAWSYSGTSGAKWQEADTNLLRLRPTPSGDPLIGVNKTGDERFHERMAPGADRFYNTYLNEIRNEGLIR